MKHLSPPYRVIGALILLVAVFLFFFRLDHRPFWQDEAETACLAKNVLKFGIPKAFDGINLISQEEGREFNPDYLWRWSPWLQIYVAAAAFKAGGLTTEAGRFPFALAGLASVWLVYLFVKRRFQDPAWALWSAALLALSVPFLLFSRQCRYYGLGALLVCLNLYAFRSDWRSRFTPAALLVGSLALLFYTNYLLFFSYSGALLLAALLVYRRELHPSRTWKVALCTILAVLPGTALFRLQQQAGMLDFTKIIMNLEHYFADLLQFMIPLPVALGLLWRWRPFFWRRPGFSLDPEERFAIFLALIILLNILIMALIPQQFFRYLVHLYPLVAILLGWVIIKVWHYHKLSGVLLAVLLLFTNFLHLLPMQWLGIINRPDRNDVYMLTYPNLPLKLYMTELIHPYPDVNASLSHFFQKSGDGDTILVSYGDLPLQFYTSCRVLGGLQGRVPSPENPPQWVVKNLISRRYREDTFTKSDDYILNHLALKEKYEPVVLPYPDETYGNREDPYYHHFVPPAPPYYPLVIYRQKPKDAPHVPGF